MDEVDGLIANAAKLDPRAWNVVGDAAPIAPARTRAFIAVQNGCDHACTFCVIPQGRGASRSLTVPEVLAEVEGHLAAGAQEVVLTGVDLTSWGHDLAGAPRLGALVEAILRAFPALPRLRLSSVDGVEIDPLLFDLLAHEPRVMPHLHLSLQHGTDLILKRMKRRHCRADAMDLVARLKALRPDITIGADLIAGFPTESEAHHTDNLSIIDQLDIVHAHIFPYSPRPGTPAARMPQLPRDMVKARAAALRERAATRRAAWLDSLVGETLPVLAERDGTGYAPNYARVALPDGTLAGIVVDVTVRTVKEGLLG
jgi:threonylcarbamoyladenosine tRNA methylthiotransferase MtaB